jgi:hypothetical protein
MKYLDYDWDLHKDRIVLDCDLNIDKLGWKAGDCFKIVNRNGKVMLVKLEDVEQFSKGITVNG